MDIRSIFGYFNNDGKSYFESLKKTIGENSKFETRNLRRSWGKGKVTECLRDLEAGPWGLGARAGAEHQHQLSIHHHWYTKPPLPSNYPALNQKIITFLYF